MTPEIRTEATLPHRLDRDGVQIAWGEWGPSTGVPLVLVHGFTGSAHDFALQLDALSQTRRVIALDHRGHGVSTKAGTVSAYSIPLLVGDVAALIDHVGGPVDLLGHSMGGRVALGVTLDRPELVRSLILMDTSAGPFGKEGSRRLAAIAAFFDAYDPTKDSPVLVVPGPEDTTIVDETPLPWRERKAILSQGVDPFAVKALGQALFDGTTISVQDRLGEIRCPTTVIVGSEDHPLVDVAPALAAAIDGAVLDVIAGAFHSPQLTHPAEWRASVERHLARAGGDQIASVTSVE